MLGFGLTTFAQVSYIKTVIISVSSYVQPPLLGHAEDKMCGSIKRNNYFTKDDLCFVIHFGMSACVVIMEVLLWKLYH